MKIHNVQQGSVEWCQLRAGIPTASEFGSMFTPALKVRTGAMVDSYVAKKVAEFWLGGPLVQFNTFDMDQGRILEEEARPFFELETGCKIEQVGFITSDDGFAGCSPDGLFSGQKVGLEIKCPRPETHVKYIAAGELPDDYAPQVHGSMFVTGFDRWAFMSYCRRFPALKIYVERDEKIIGQIREGLNLFKEKFDALVADLVDRNGGPPKRNVFQFTPKTETEDLKDDLIP